MEIGLKVNTEPMHTYPLENNKLKELWTNKQTYRHRQDTRHTNVYVDIFISSDMEFSDDEVREELAKYGYHNLSKDKLKEFKKGKSYFNVAIDDSSTNKS